MMPWSTRLFAALLPALSLPVGAVDYELPDLEGRVRSLDEYRGKWVVVNYWATWCGTCLKELPDLIALHENNRGKDIAVIGIDFESIAPDSLQDFVAGHAIPYPVLRSEPVPVTPLGPVPALPTTYIIDPEGTVVAGEIGIVTRENIEDYIASQRAARAEPVKATP
ncbi:MAG: TlpA family protein disulfide reductase [Pseudomonadota bacterium]